MPSWRPERAPPGKHVWIHSRSLALPFKRHVRLDESTIAAEQPDTQDLLHINCVHVNFGDRNAA